MKQEAAQGVTIVSGVSGGELCGTQGEDQGGCDWGVFAMARCQFERDGAATSIDNGMDFCRTADARAADRLDVDRPFAPAAERCALTVVLSIR
jgi:hypothetical protein